MSSQSIKTSKIFLSNSFTLNNNKTKIESKTSNSERETLNTNKNELIKREKLNNIPNKNEELENRKIIHLSNITDNISCIIQNEKNDYEEKTNELNDNIIEIKENGNNNLKRKIIKYNYCLIWKKIPFISSIFPFIGHLIIINSEGKSYDFSSSNYIDINNEYIGNPIKIIHLDLNDIQKNIWDIAIIIVTKKYKKKEFSFCGYNSYSFLAEIFNIVKYKNRKNYSSFEVFKYSIKNAKYTSIKMIFINYVFIFLMIIFISFLVASVN